MRFYQIEQHPLRVYIQGEVYEIQRLISSLDYKLNGEATVHEKSYKKDTEELENIVLKSKSDYYYFPIGLLTIVRAEAERLGYEVVSDVELSNPQYEFSAIDENFLDGITLRPYQLEGIEACLRYHKGLIQVATGGGKTEIMIGVCRYLQQNEEGNILICVPSSKLLHQTVDRMKKRGIEEKDISLFGDGYALNTSCRIAVGTVQTVYRRISSSDENTQYWLHNVRCLMMDEAQHSAAVTWYSIIDYIAPEYNLGFSAEPFYGDKDHVVRDLILRGTVGSVIHRISMNYLIEKGYLSKPYMLALETCYNGNIYKLIDWHTVNKTGVINNQLRNQLICDTAIRLASIGKPPLILISQIAHGQELAKKISQGGFLVAFLTGGHSVTVYSDGREIDSYTDSEGMVTKDFQEGKYGALIGTSIMDEGVDIPAISSVILAGAGKSSLKLVQRVGRGLRIKKGDNTTMIIDFQDKFNIVLHSQFKKRKAKFESMGIPIYFCKTVDGLESLVNQLRDSRKGL